MCVTWIGPSQGGSLTSWRMYIDVSFPRPSSAPHLDILVDRQSNCTGLHTFFTALVPRLTESRDIISRSLSHMQAVVISGQESLTPTTKKAGDAHSDGKQGHCY